MEISEKMKGSPLGVDFGEKNILNKYFIYGWKTLR